MEQNARPRTTLCVYSGLYAWDTISADIASLNTKFMGILMDESVSLAPLVALLQAATSPAQMLAFLVKHGVPDTKYLDSWKDFASFASFRQAYDRITLLAKPIDVTVRTHRQTLVTIEFTYDVTNRWLDKTGASIHIDYSYEQDGQTHYVYDADIVDQIAQDDATHIFLQVKLPKSSDQPSTRTYSFYLRGQCYVPYPTLSSLEAAPYAQTVFLAKLRRSLNAIMQIGTGLFPLEARALATQGLLLAPDSSYWYCYFYPSSEQTHWFAPN